VFGRPHMDRSLQEDGPADSIGQGRAKQSNDLAGKAPHQTIDQTGERIVLGHAYMGDERLSRQAASDPLGLRCGLGAWAGASPVNRAAAGSHPVARTRPRRSGAGRHGDRGGTCPGYPPPSQSWADARSAARAWSADPGAIGAFLGGDRLFLALAFRLSRIFQGLFSGLARRPDRCRRAPTPPARHREQLQSDAPQASPARRHHTSSSHQATRTGVFRRSAEAKRA
jgi:hypothetical protein